MYPMYSTMVLNKKSEVQYMSFNCISKIDIIKKDSDISV